MKKNFPNGRMKHRPLIVNFRPLRRAINRRVAWSLIAVIGLLASLACAVPSFGQILATAQLNVERRGHTATLLEDGRVLIIGGDNLNGMVSQAEIFDPMVQTSSLAGPSNAARTDHTATRLTDGRVLVIGGRDQSGALTSTEIFNPVTAAFTAGPSMTAPRSGHMATALANGNILVAGGDASGSAEIYNLATQTFSPIAANMTAARKFHSAILTSSGQVLIVGGVNAQNAMLNTAEVFDPASQSFYIPPTDMQTQRALATLKLLPDGKVQIIGGDAELSMEVFDPTNGIFIAKALLPPNANLLGATLSTQSRAALFSPLVLQDPLLQGVMTPEQSTLLDRADQSITELPSRNQALVAGGINSAGQILNSAKLVSSSTASVTTDKTDYAPGQIVTITGSGFQPNEHVDIYFHEFPEEYPDIFLSVIANQQGSFVTAEFAPQDIDLGRVFTLTAIGQSSGFTAQTAFKDNHTMTVSCSPGSISTGSPTTCTGTIGNGTNGQPASGRTVTFTSNGSGGFSSTTCVTSGSNATASCSVNYTPSAVGTGTHRITGSFSFTGGGGHANSNFFDLTVQKANQTITFGALVNKTFGDPDFTVSATASSGLTVSFSSTTTAKCTVSGNTVHIVEAGLCTIRASQAGNTNYNAAPDVDQSFTIEKAASTTVVTFEAGPYMYRGTPFTATAVVTGVGGLNQAVAVVYSGDCTNVTTANGCTATATFAGDTNHHGSSDSKSITITTGFAFNGFHSPIGGSVENGNGGSYANPLKTFKLGSTIPVKFGATWLNGGAALITGIHTLQAVKYSNATDSDPPIDASPTDAATTGNQFRLTSTDWHFNLSTKGNGFSAGTWLLIATLEDGSKHTVWITIKK